MPEGAGVGLAEGLAAAGTARETEEATSDPSLRTGLDEDEPIFVEYEYGGDR